VGRRRDAGAVSVEVFLNGELVATDTAIPGVETPLDLISTAPAPTSSNWPSTNCPAN
jgi:hypothetical protein